MDKRLFESMSLDLKADYTYAKGEFIGQRQYGFLKFAIYKCPHFYVEIMMDKEIQVIKDIILGNEGYLRKLVKNKFK